MNLLAAKNFALDLLQYHLSDELTYHSLSHTLDVCQSVQEIGHEEGVSQESLLLLETAAMFHDLGFTETYQGHEAVGCRIAREQLPHMAFSTAQIEQICGMIMATKVPQQPQTHFEEIICDADLYYLGRDDFFPVGWNLYHEFLNQGIVTDEQSWNQLQVRFLSSHSYFTETAKRHRAARKAQHLAQLTRLVESYSRTRDN